MIDNNPPAQPAPMQQPPANQTALSAQPAHADTLGTIQHSLKPIATKQQGAAKRSQHTSTSHVAEVAVTWAQQARANIRDSSAAKAPVTPVLPDSPFQPDSRSHVAALASSLARQGHGSVMLPQTEAAAELEDSPFQPTTRSHVAELAHMLASQRSSNSSSKPHTPQHTPVLADSGDFQPNSQSHVSALAQQLAKKLSGDVENSRATQHGTPDDCLYPPGSSLHVAQVSAAVTSRLQGFGAEPHVPEDCPYQPDSKAHVAMLAKAVAGTAIADSTSSGISSKARSPPAHHTQNKLPLAREAVGTYFTQQQDSCSTSLVQTEQQQGKPAMLQIVHLSYGKTAPFQGVPASSQVAKVVHRLSLQGDDSRKVEPSSADTSQLGNSCSDCQQAGCSIVADGGVSDSGTLPQAATPNVSGVYIVHCTQVWPMHTSLSPCIGLHRVV